MAKLLSITGKALSGEWGCDDETGEGIPVLRTTNFTNEGIVNYNDVVTRIITKKNIDEKYLRKGDIIIEKSGGSDKQPVGRVIYFEGAEKTYLFNNFTGLLRVKDVEKWNPEYVFYSMYANYLRGGTRQFENRTTGLHNLQTDAYISSLEIRENSIDRQDEICANIRKTRNVINLRTQELEELDNLIKSRFVEMFGNPIRNTQHRPTTEFINVVKMQRGFDLPVQDRQQDGDIPVFGSNGALDRHDVAKVQGGGVITGRSGTIGKVYYTEGDYWPLNTSLFSVNTHGNNIIYLAYLLQMYDLSRFTEGTGVPTLNRNKFHDKPIIDVPLNQQEQFAVLVKQIDKLKFRNTKIINTQYTKG